MTATAADEPAAAPALNPRVSAAAALGSRIAGRVLGIVFVVYLARSQSEATFAAYSYLLVLATTIGTLSDTGISAIAVREVARGQASVATAYRGGGAVALAVGGLGAILMLVAGLLDSGPGSGGGALVATSVFIGLNLFFGFQAELLRAAGRPEREAQLQIAGAVLQLILGVAVVAAGGGVAALMTVIAVKELMLALAAHASLPRPWHGERRHGWWRELLRMGLWLGGATTAVAVMVRLPQIVVGNAAPVTDIAQYSAASRVLDLSMTFTTILALALFPWVAQRVHRDTAFPGWYQSRTVLAAGASVVVALVLVAVLPPVFDLVFGNGYHAAAEPAQVLMLSLPVLVALFAAWTILVALGQERLVGIWAGVGLAAAALSAITLADDPTPLRAALATVSALGVTAIGLSVAMVRAVHRGDVAAPEDE